MRTLVIGIPLPQVTFDNYSFLSAPSFSDYQRMIVNTEAVSRVVQEVIEGGEQHATFAGQPVVNGPSSAGRFSLAEALTMRRREAERFLDGGGTAVCLTYPDVRHEGVEGLGEWRRYAWLPAPDGFRYEDDLLPGFGNAGVELVDGRHPFAPYIETFGPRLSYRALANEDAPGFQQHGRVFARSPGGAAVAFQLRVSRGYVVFLPPLPRFESERAQLANTLFECFGPFPEGPPESQPQPPEWIRKEAP